jgi:ribosomal protein S18 acetylase RimI-like enzyme
MVSYDGIAGLGQVTGRREVLEREMIQDTHARGFLEMKPGAEVRDYREDDLEEVLALARELDAGQNGHEEEERCQNHYLMPRTKYTVSVARSGENNIAGYIVGFPFTGIPIMDRRDKLPFDLKPERFLIGMVFVSEPYRRQGIAAQLVNALIVKAKRAGYKQICSRVPKSNELSIALHRSLGFKEIDISGEYMFFRVL